MLKTNCVIFTRVSTSKQDASGLGREDQERVCREWAANNGTTIHSVLHSTMSGKFDEQMNSQLGQAIETAKAIDGFILVAKLDRLSRSVETVARYLNNGVAFVSVEFGREIEPVFLHILSAVSEFERKLASDRTRRALAAKRARGERLGASDEVLESAREAAEIVRRQQARERNEAKLVLISQAAMFITAGHRRPTYSSLAEALNTDTRLTAQRNEMNSPKGRWYPNTVSQVIRHCLENNYGADSLRSIQVWPKTLDGVNPFNPDEWLSQFDSQ